jgi:hypothetical protein
MYNKMKELMVDVCEADDLEIIHSNCIKEELELLLNNFTLISTLIFDVAYHTNLLPN